MSLTDSQKIKDILERGTEKIIERDHLEARLKGGRRLRVKFGIDPTASEIHLGTAVVLRKLKQLQNLGHKIIFLIGDFTARIGDPSKRSETRRILTEKEIKKNMRNYERQAAKILDIKKTEIRHNSEWYAKKPVSFFLDLLSRFTVARVLERDDFQKRLKAGVDISLLEIVYPVLQGYDSVVVKADLELGGADQEFNMLFGRRAQKKFNQDEQDILIVPLLEGTDGVRKMSKSYSNTINLMDLPQEMYGKLMSISDHLLWKYLELTTDLSLAEINELKKKTEAGFLNPREAKARLAYEVAAFYHSPKAASAAAAEFNRVFREKAQPEQMSEAAIKEKQLPILDLLVKIKLSSSRSQAQRLVEQGAIKINGQSVKDWRLIVDLKDKMIIQAGHRRFVRIKAV